MSDVFTRAKRSEVMSRIRSKDTKPELAVRRLVFSMGYRYRLQARELPGRPDIIFRSSQRVMFVHGCFWHRHAGKCRRATMPKSRLGYWGPKLEANKKRDRSVEAKLRARGWRVLVVWECQLSNLDKVRSRIAKFMRGA